jgi:molecular chaperone DnaJ
LRNFAQLAHQNHYELLGVSLNATTAEIRKAYRRLALVHHPDTAATADAAKRFMAIAEACRILSNPYERRVYDRLLATRQYVAPEPPETTPQRLLEIAEELNASLRTMNRQTVVADRLEAYILLILNDEHLDILEKADDDAATAGLIAQILLATNHLHEERIGEINRRLLRLSKNFPELAKEIEQSHAKHSAAMLRKKWTPIAAVAVTILLCLFMYWYGRA